MRNSVRSIIIAVIAIAAIGGIAWGLHLVTDTNTATAWYTQIDNERIVEKEHANNEYEYTLDAYDANGAHREATFGTERTLRDDAYLKLEMMPMRGVISWEEVQLEDIPEATRNAAGWSDQAQ